ncbi:ATP-binding protein [Mycolicibacterium baixiangningiae]|uniref:ATP-binding protein n=1 Tax=Mycolicibacterium baixiangningiae TaxID=2761578 RepID=UPI0018696854|nr:LuxR family transcriptional regulator [Mycolicibacterium baixiangningiae]
MTTLRGRRAERDILDQLADAVSAGESRALVLHGEPGVGKTALMEYLAARASGCRVVRAVGVQQEMELAYAGLHQLCVSMVDTIGRLPVPQRDALRTAFGMSAGPPPDRFLVGLAVLGLLSDTADEQPLLCLIDDEQWLDRVSAQILAFVARRLAAESVALIFAARTPSSDLQGLPQLALQPLPEKDARALLDDVLAGRLDAMVRNQIVAEARGNPLALVELPRALTTPQLAGGFGLAGAVQLPRSAEESIQRQFEVLPGPTRHLLVIAAADPTGDPALVWRAARRLGIGEDAALPAREAGLCEYATRVRFRHPLVRSAAYQSASPEQRRQAHGALAEATDGRLDPDRRAWHRAHAARGPDEDVAVELVGSAGRAQARGGMAAAAAFLERATMLTSAADSRVDRALAAAWAKVQAGEGEGAAELLSTAEVGPLGDAQQARVDLVRAELAFVTSRGSDAPPLLLKAAGRLESVDPDLSRETYLEAFSAALFAGRLAVGADVLEVAGAAATAPHSAGIARAPDLLLDGLVAHYHQGYPTCLPLLRGALASFGTGMSAEAELRWLWLASIAAIHVWDERRWDALSDRHVHLARANGALSELPLALSSRVFMQLFSGDLAAAAALVEESQAATDATGNNLAPYGRLGLAAMRGSLEEVAALTETTERDVTSRGEGIGITVTAWANALLNNGHGDYARAVTAAERAIEYVGDITSSTWATVELIEASVRAGKAQTAEDAFRRLTDMTDASDTEWARGIAARSGALLNEGEAAEQLYREAIERLGRTSLRSEVARAHLLYGEWLRRQHRRIDARVQLVEACTMLEEMGMDAFAQRARRELKATGQTARKRSLTSAPTELTAQEAQIARLARDGLSNPEIGARLFISARTVQYHLSKVFTKLGINSRSRLDRALPPT